jgi:hypothetical protein
MRDSNFFRDSYRIKNNISAFLKHYKISIIIICCCFLIGLIAGIFTSSSYSSSLELESIPDANLVAFICGDKSSFSLFFSYVIELGLVICCILFLNFNFFCSIVNIGYILVRGYSLGFTIFSLVTLYSFAGIINVVIIIVPFWFCINFVLILISAISVSKNRVIKKFGKHCYTNNNPRRLIFLLVILLLAILFLMCMLTPIIKITIIVN